jgi:hypothetical protein
MTAIPAAAATWRNCWGIHAGLNPPFIRRER